MNLEITKAAVEYHHEKFDYFKKYNLDMIDAWSLDDNYRNNYILPMGMKFPNLIAIVPIIYFLRLNFLKTLCVSTVTSVSVFTFHFLSNRLKDALGYFEVCYHSATFGPVNST